MIKLRSLTILLSAAFVSSLIAGPVTESGAMKRSGSKIIGTKSNSVVQVAGPSLYWSIWGGEKFYNSGAVAKVVTDWNASLIRAAIGVEGGKGNGGYLEKPDQQLALATAVVDAAIANDIYVIVDWHDHNANQHVTQSKAFFKAMAEKYKNTPNVIWEIWNEPDGSGGTGEYGKDTWSDIKAYANEIIPVIRASSSNLIVIGTSTWSQDVDLAANDPVADENVAYALHFYSGTHKDAIRAKAETALSKGVALFITEFGTTTSDGGQKDGTIYTDETKKWLDWADVKGISWANWSLVNMANMSSDTAKEASAILNKSCANTTGGWSDSDLSTSGKWIVDRLRSRPKTQNTDSAMIMTSVQGGGTVTMSPSSTKVKKGTEVTFTAVPSTGYSFKAWSGASTSTSNPLTLTINENTTLTAVFAAEAGTNMVKSGDFSDATQWTSWADNLTNDATISFANEQVSVTIRKADTVNWKIQVRQEGIPLVAGETLTLTFDAWSSGERILFAQLSSATTYHFQGGEEVTLTDAKQTFTFDMTPDSTTDEGILQFNCGKSTLPVYIDNVSLVKKVPVSVSKTVSGIVNNGSMFNLSGNKIFWNAASANATASIVALSGRVLQKSIIARECDLSGLPSGTYCFIINDGIKQQSFKFTR
ncbi:MAG: cellulase family glycosylhydrolase [Fibrobacter sp.]|nr:cellulase family glycosylhydrolase [Fibrobacter sp.]